MNFNKAFIIKNIILFVLGGVLISLGFANIIDEFWSSLGFALVFVGIVRLVQTYRFKNDKTYKEKVEIASKDERNHFIRARAWAWAGYLFIFIAGVSIIVFKILGQDLLSFVASSAVCLIMILFWFSYLILQKKY